jgi:hypothetical protein
MSERRQRDRRATDQPKPPCPRCGCDRSAVVDVPGVSTHAAVYCRRRECAECRHRWTTYESNFYPTPISGVAVS